MVEPTMLLLASVAMALLIVWAVYCHLKASAAKVVAEKSSIDYKNGHRLG